MSHKAHLASTSSCSEVRTWASELGVSDNDADVLLQRWYTGRKIYALHRSGELAACLEEDTLSRMSARLLCDALVRQMAPKPAQSGLKEKNERHPRASPPRGRPHTPELLERSVHEEDENEDDDKLSRQEASSLSEEERRLKHDAPIALPEGFREFVLCMRSKLPATERAQVMRNTLPTTASLSEIIKYCSRSDEHQKQFFAGYCFRYGLGCSKNLREMQRLYERAASNGNLDAKVDFANALLEEWDRDPESVSVALQQLAVKYLRETSEKSVEAIWNLGDCYSKGFGVKRDREAAITYYNSAAERGSSEAHYKLGKLYLSEGDSPSKAQARTHFQKARDLGSADAVYAIYEMSEDEEHKRTLLEEAAKKGSALAKERLGKRVLDTSEQMDKATESTPPTRRVKRPSIPLSSPNSTFGDAQRPRARAQWLDGLQKWIKSYTLCAPSTPLTKSHKESLRLHAPGPDEMRKIGSLKTLGDVNDLIEELEIELL